MREVTLPADSGVRITPVRGPNVIVPGASGIVLPTVHAPNVIIPGASGVIMPSFSSRRALVPNPAAADGVGVSSGSGGAAPPDPVLRHQSTTLGTADSYGNDRCQFHEGFLYFTYSATVVALDVTDPINPVVLSTVDVAETIASIGASGNFLFVVGTSGAVYTIGLADVNAISLEATFDPAFGGEFEGWAWAVISGNLLYTQGHFPGGAGAGSIVCYGITDPYGVTLVARARHPEGSWGGGGVALVGNTLWVGDYFSSISRPDNAFVFHGLDVTIPAVMTVNYTYTVDCSVREDFHAWGLFGGASTLYIIDFQVIEVWNVATPGAPVHVLDHDGGADSSDLEGCGMLGNDYLFTGSSFGGKLEVFTLTDPLNPVLQSQQSATSAMGRGVSFDPAGRMFFCAIGGYLAIYTY